MRDRCVDRDAVRSQLEGELAGEGDDAALGGGIGAAARDAEAAPGDRRQVDDLAALLPLHHRHHSVGEEERATQVEVDQRPPVVEAQLVDRGAGFGDDRAAADRVDQDVDRGEFLRHRRDGPIDLRRVERVTQPGVRPPAGLAQFCHRPVEPLRVVVDRDDDPAFARDNVGGGAADAARRRGDQRHLVLKAHPSPFRKGPCLCMLGARPARERGGCNSGFICRMPAARRRRS